MKKNIFNAILIIAITTLLTTISAVSAEKIIVDLDRGTVETYLGDENSEIMGRSIFHVYQGGTGASSFTSGECLVGNGTGAITTAVCGGAGGTGGSSIWSTSTDGLYYNNIDRVMVFGGTATTSDYKFEVIGGIYTDSATTTQTLHVLGDQFNSQYIKHYGDNDTYLSFATDQINLDSGGVEFIEISEGASDILKINDGGVDVDFQVKGNSDDNLLYADASTDRVGIGMNNPSYLLDVDGTLRSSKYLLGADLSLIPIVGGQSVITTWHGMQLVGNKQSTVDYSPSGIGGNNDFSVIIPNQKADKIGLIVQGAGSQTGNLQEWRDSSLNTLSVVDSSGKVGLGDSTPSDKLDITVSDTDNVRGLNINQNDTTNNPEGMRLTSTAAENAIAIDMNADAGNSTSVGGALNIDNTGNIGAGLVVYSNMNGDADGRLVNIRADNSLFDQPALHVDYDGTANAVEIVGNGVTDDAVALSINHTNWTATALGISGDVENHGMIKVSHLFPSSGVGATWDDSSASILSMDFRNSSSTVDTYVQGIFSTATVGNGTRGKLINLRNITPESGVAAELFTLTYDGMLGLLDASPDARFEITGTTTDPYMYVTSFGGADGNVFSIDASGQVGVGVADPTYSFEVAGNAGFDEYIYHNDDADTYIKYGTNRVQIDSGGTRTADFVSGEVGILTASPAHSLDVNGGVRIVDYLIIPNDDTVATSGAITLDTTSNQTHIYGTSSKIVLDEDGIKTACFSISSSTALIAGGTYKVFAPRYAAGITFFENYCEADGGTSVVVNATDGTNDMTSVTCSTSGATSQAATNNTFSKHEQLSIEIGTVTGAVKGFNWCGYFRINSN